MADQIVADRQRKRLLVSSECDENVHVQSIPFSTVTNGKIIYTPFVLLHS